MCQACMMNSPKTVQRTTWAIWGALAVLILVLSIRAGRYDQLLNYFESILLIVLVSPFTVILHEFGHATVALMFRWEVYLLVLGAGRPLWQGRIRNTLLQWRLIQVGGLAGCFPRAFGFWFRPQAFLMILGGPVANLFGGIVGVVLYAFAEEGTLASAALGWWCFLNLFSFFLNLIPFKTQAFGVPLGSDGMQLFWILFKPRFYRQRVEYSSWISRFATLRLLGEHQQARDLIARLAEDRPDDLMAHLNLSAAEYELGNYPETIAVAERGLELIRNGATPDPALSVGAPHMQVKFFEAGLKDNIASALLDMPGADLDRALELAREVHETMPWMSEIQATYGYALARTGSPTEGLQLLHKALTKMHEQPKSVQERVKRKAAEAAALCQANATAVGAETA